MNATSSISGWSYRLAPDMVICTAAPGMAAELPGKVLVVPGRGAFPAGHPTTRLCLDLLREGLTARPVQSLVDVGCGAGVLALAAAALGVPQVLAVDLAWPAARATCDNARENGLAGGLRVAQGSTECLRKPCDLVAANLPWEVQLDKVTELARLTAPGGRLLLSGFQDNQEEELREKYLQLGRSVRRRVVKEFWHPELPPKMSFTWVGWLLE
jgi:ribosomal protein L11 methyltransferase